MKYIIHGLTFLLIAIVVNGALSYLRQPKEAEKGTVYLPKFFAILGTVTSAILIIFAIISVFTDEPIWVPILFLLFSLLGVTLVVAFVNCRISYDEEGFVAKNLFGIKRKFKYDQVTAIKENTRENYIYIGRRSVMIDEVSIGGSDFIKLVKKKYRTMHDGQSLPLYKTTHDIFNGNVSDVGEFLFIYTLIAVIAIGFLIFAVYYTYFTPSTARNTIKQSVSFVSCDAKEEIILISSDEQIYKIRFADEQFNAEDIQAICDGKTMVTAYSKEVTPDDGDNYYSIKAIVYNDNYLLSFEETNRFHSQENWPFVVFAAALCFSWGAFVIGSVIVGRTPQKFSRGIVRLFFKDGYVKC